MIFLSAKAVSERLGVSRSTVWRYARVGHNGFPQPVKISAGVTRWCQSEVEDWQAANVRSRQGTA